MHYKIDLTGPTVLERDAAIPAEFRNWALEALADIGAAIDPVPAGYEGIGFWPVVEQDDPTLDPAFEERDPDNYSEILDPIARAVAVTYGKRDRPIEDVRAEKIAALKAEADGRFAISDILLVLGALYKRARGTADTRETAEIDTLAGVYAALRGALDWIEDPTRTVQELAGYDVVVDPVWP